MKVFLLALLTLVFLLGSEAIAATPCDKAFVIRDGKMFDPEVAKKPGFDSKTAPTVPWCDTDTVPLFMIEQYEKDAGRASDLEKKLQISEDLRDAERVFYEDVMKIERGYTIACEKEKFRPPPEVAFYEKAWFGAVLGSAATVAITVLVVYAAK